MKFQLEHHYYSHRCNIIHHRLLGPVLMWNLILLALSGCTTAVIPPVQLAPPVSPIAPADWTPDDAREFSQACFGAPEPLNQTGPIAEILFNYNNEARDFRDSQGPDVYLLQIIPLDNNFKSTPMTGHLTFILFAESALKPDGSIGQPVNIWRIAPQDLGQHWMPTHLLESYLFQLDWGAVIPQPGNYEFVVHITYEHNNQTVNICRALSFYEKQETRGQ
ncbi:MAG: hypothetical protein GY869_24015 [Planctomycetes bacterium]|nr:hypothetical protein [Planctomycetota bacterium]